MSSMDHNDSFRTLRRPLSRPWPLFALLATSALTLSLPASAQTPREWDEARQQMQMSSATASAAVIDRWETLSATRGLGFDSYADFMLANPGFPKEDTLQARAEAALDDEPVSAARLVAFFDRFAPSTNSARARYALALADQNRPDAVQIAREAWRGGEMSGPSSAYLEGLFGSQFTQADHDARMDALLWQGDVEGARRQIAQVTPGKQPLYMARFAYLQDQSPQNAGLPVPAEAMTDPGYAYNQLRYLRKIGQTSTAVDMLANRPAFAQTAFDGESFLTNMLRLARGGTARQALQIASKADDLFEENADIRTKSYRIRDDYTSLMWLGGTEALWSLGDAASAAPLFYRYGAAAQTPQTRSKGFYWAGRASKQAGDSAAAEHYFGMAANYPDRFYGMLAMDELGRTIPDLRALDAPVGTQANYSREFLNAPLTNAVREVSRNAPWRTGIQFYRAIAQNAETPEEHGMVASLARDIGRRDLAVNVHDAAGSDGIRSFTDFGHPTLDVPQGTNWTIVHAIARQESQFAENAISHAGARGLLQLMPATAREQAGKLGLSYSQSNLIADPKYNIRLGDAYFARMLSYYDGAYPLAIAAYNAGPGNVNKWLRANGDPRTGSIDWVTWGERIPIYETKNYVQRVLENAVVYEHLHPDKARFGSPRKLSNYLR
ncbi:MAG: lytic transglycosylase domain-containing protein [Pontixanthobacter sp.]